MPPSLIADRFEIVERLEDRGLGEPWRCRDPQRAGGPVMVKLLAPVGSTLPPALEELLLRTRLTRHDAAFKLYDYGLWGDRPDAAFELFEGASLGDGLDRARASGELIALDLLREAFDSVVAALDAAHRAPRCLLHLSLDPSCVILRRLPGKPLKVKVLDFGLAAWATPDPRTPPRSARSLRCAAPESSDASQASPQSDVFSLAALLREMLSTPPEPGAPLEPAGAERRRADVPVEVWAEIERATSLDPSQRHATVRSFADAVRGALARPIAPRPEALARPAETSAGAARRDEAPRLHAPSPSPAVEVPVAGPMPRLSREVVQSSGDTIVLANVAARRAPSPWDLGALRDERAEAEEEAAAGWLRAAPSTDGQTLVASTPASRASIDETNLAVTTPRKGRWRPVGLPTASPPASTLADDAGETLVAAPMPTVRTPPPDAELTMPTLVAAPPPGVNHTSNLRAVDRGSNPRGAPTTPTPAPSPERAATSATGQGGWMIVGGVALVVIAALVALVAWRS